MWIFPGTFRSILILAAITPFLLAAPTVAHAASKPVMVHYMPWFVSQPYSGSWGWHWTMNYFNPNIVNTNGEQAIASWYYPLIGPVSYTHLRAHETGRNLV